MLKDFFGGGVGRGVGESFQVIFFEITPVDECLNNFLSPCRVLFVGYSEICSLETFTSNSCYNFGSDYSAVPHLNKALGSSRL